MRSDAEWGVFLGEVLGRFGCQTGTLHFTDGSGESLDLVTQVGVPEGLVEKIRVIPFGKGIAGAAAAQREPVEMCNLQTDTSGVARPDAKQTGVVGSLAVPIFSADGERVLGTLGIGKYVPYDFTAEEKSAVGEIAAGIGKEIES